MNLLRPDYIHMLGK